MFFLPLVFLLDIDVFSMPETCRLAEAAFALSQLLQANSIPHAFHGNILTAILSDSPRCHVSMDELSRRRRLNQSVTGNLLHCRRQPHETLPSRPPGHSK